MASQWMRMINSAQRVITLSESRFFKEPTLESLRLDIQGITYSLNGQEIHARYLDMAANGIHKGWAKPLGVMQRLRREQTPLGWIQHETDHRIQLTFWDEWAIALHFDLEHDGDGEAFRETEIMVMSAGFCFSNR